MINTYIANLVFFSNFNLKIVWCIFKILISQRSPVKDITDFFQVIGDDVLTSLWRTIIASGRKGAEKQKSSPKSPLMYAYYDTEYLGKMIELVAYHKVSVIVYLDMNSFIQQEQYQPLLGTLQQWCQMKNK